MQSSTSEAMVEKHPFGDEQGEVRRIARVVLTQSQHYKCLNVNICHKVLKMLLLKKNASSIAGKTEVIYNHHKKDYLILQSS